MTDWKKTKLPLPEWLLPENQEPHVSGASKLGMAAQMAGIGLALLVAVGGFAVFLAGLL